MAFRGVLRIAAGIVGVVWPGAVAIAIAIVFGAFAVASGLTALAGAQFLPSEFRRRSLLRRFGAVGVVLGVLTLARPGFTLFAAMALIGIAAVVHGLRHVRDTRGVATALAGVLVLVRPGIAITALGLTVAGAAIVSGLRLVRHAQLSRRRLALPAYIY